MEDGRVGLVRAVVLLGDGDVDGDGAFEVVHDLQDPLLRLRHPVLKYPLTSTAALYHGFGGLLWSPEKSERPPTR